jgi:phosphatidylglycerol---prolipoprotein diacylglyceryl transferase
MIPVLFKIGPVPINSYGLMLVIGFICAYFLLVREFRQRGVDEDFASTEITVGMIGAIVGSRIFHIMEHLDSYSLANPAKFFIGSGFSWYGGFVLAAILIIWTGRKKGIHWATLMDASAPAIAIGYGFGRIGCFLSGDGCYGLPCKDLGLSLPIPLCMAFPKGAVPTSEIVLNTPLFEVAGAVLTFSYLMLARRWVKTPTWLFAQFVIIHAILRFAVEFVRQNPKFWLGFSQAQWVSIGGLAIGAALLWYGPRIKVPEPRIESPSKKPGKKKK